MIDLGGTNICPAWWSSNLKFRKRKTSEHWHIIFNLTWFIHSFIIIKNNNSNPPHVVAPEAERSVPKYHRCHRPNRCLKSLEAQQCARQAQWTLQWKAAWPEILWPMLQNHMKSLWNPIEWDQNMDTKQLVNLFVMPKCWSGYWLLLLLGDVCSQLLLCPPEYFVPGSNNQHPQASPITVSDYSQTFLFDICLTVGSFYYILLINPYKSCVLRLSLCQAFGI